MGGTGVYSFGGDVKFARGAEQGGAGVELQGELWGNRVDEETMERTVSACVLEAKVRGGRGQGWGRMSGLRGEGTGTRGEQGAAAA